jgi:transposase InsO family protein
VGASRRRQTANRTGLGQRGIAAVENRVARLRSQQRIWSALAKKPGLKRKAGPPVHNDLVDRKFTAPNVIWLTDITEHNTAEGKLYLCAIKDRLLRADRRLFHRLKHERLARGRDATQRHHLTRPGRHRGPL